MAKAYKCDDCKELYPGSPYNRLEHPADIADGKVTVKITADFDTFDGGPDLCHQCTVKLIAPK